MKNHYLIKNFLVATMVGALTVSTANFSSASTKPTGKKLTVAAADKIYDSAVEKTTLWMNKSPFTVTESIIQKGVTYSLQTTIDKVGSIRKSEDGIAYEVVIGETIYIHPESVEYRIDDYAVETAQKMGLVLDKSWSKDTFEENWSDNYPRLYGYMVNQVRESYIDHLIYIATPGEHRMKNLPDKFITAYWYPKGKDISSGTLKLSSKADGSTKAQTLSVTIEKGKITSTSELEGSSYQIITKYQSFDKTISVPTGPFLELDQIRRDLGYQVKRTEYLAKNIAKSISRDAETLAIFDGLEKPSFTNYEDVINEFKHTGITLYNGAMEIRIKYGNNPYTYCAPEASGFSSAEVVTLIGTCAGAGFTARIS